jgi:cytochrome c-type biogenesis protein CcmH
MTPLFWGLTLLLTLGALLLLLLPLLRAGTHVTPAAMEQARLAVFDQQLRDLEGDLANGLLEASQFARARADLERSLLEDSQDRRQPETPGAGPTTGRLTAVGLVLAVPALALATYLQVGGGLAALEPGQQATTMAAPGEHEMDRLLEELRARMADRPDPRGLALLARSLVAIGRVEQALEAYDQALAQGGDRDPAVLAQYADLLATATGRLEGRPLALVRQALALDPDHPQSLWLAGTAAYQDRDYPAARRYWQRLLAVLPPDSEGVPIIEQELHELERRLGEDG